MGHMLSEICVLLFCIVASLAAFGSSLNIDFNGLNADLNGALGLNNQFAIATLVSSEEYVYGAIALAGSLQNFDIPLEAVVVSQDHSGLTGLSDSSIQWLKMSKWNVREVPASKSIRCAAMDASSLSRFQNGCAKIHLWSELVGIADRVLYLDADNLVRPVFNPEKFFASYGESLFAAKPTPPDTQDCGGTQAQLQLGEENRKLTLTFEDKSIGLAVSNGVKGNLEIAGVREPAASKGVQKGFTMTHINGESLQGVSSTMIANIFQNVPRPISISFLRNDYDQVDSSDSDRPLFSGLHHCHDLFNSNIFILTPSLETFQQMSQSLEQLKLDPKNYHSTAFDSGFFSRFFGKYWESDKHRWLPFRNHLEMTLNVKHWPFHPIVSDKAEEVARSLALGNMLSWSEILTLDFSGSTKPWHVLEATQQVMATRGRTDDVLGVAYEVLDRAVPGGNGSRRPFVDLYLTLWVQWLGAYSRGCAMVMGSPDFVPAKDSNFCAMLPELASAFKF